jgi:DNA-binding protein
MNSDENIETNTTQPSQEQETPKEEPAPEAIEKAEVVEESKGDEPEDNRDKPMNIVVSQNTQLRRMISAAIARVKANQPVTMKAFGRNQHKAVTLASIVRDRVGNLHQLNSFVEEKTEKDGKERLFVGI